MKLASKIEIVLEFWIFVFFLIFSWKKSDLKEVKIRLIELWIFISFELRHLTIRSFFQLEIKIKQRFKIRQKFQYLTPIKSQTKYSHRSSFLWWFEKLGICFKQKPYRTLIQWPRRPDLLTEKCFFDKEPSIYTKLGWKNKTKQNKASQANSLTNGTI